MNSKVYILLSGLILSAPLLVLAQQPFSPLVGIPGLPEDQNFAGYINALYVLAISVAGLLAVIKLIVAGTKYMLSDIVTTKQEAISDIRGSILGLIIVLSAVLVLTVINPQLVNLNVFGQITPVQAPTKLAPPSGGAPKMGGDIPPDSPGSLPTPGKPCSLEGQPGVGCLEVEQECTNKKGKPGPRKNLTPAEKTAHSPHTHSVDCSFGKEQGVSCKEKCLGVNIEGDCNNRTYDCTEAIKYCNDKLEGVSHLQPPNNEKIICITPH